MYRVLFLFIACGLCAKDAEWLQLRTPNFELITTAGEKRGRDAIQFLETTHSFFETLFGIHTTPPLPTRVILFRSESEYKQFNINESAAAYYVPGFYRDYIVMRPMGEDTNQITIHEYTHRFIHQAGWRPPVWLNEGLAEFYSTMKPVGAKVEIGSVILGRAYALQQGRPMKINELMDVDHKSPSYNEKDRRGLFYAQAWLLTHMVMMSENYRAGSLQFLNEVLAKRTPPPEALLKIYGKSLDQVQADFTSYIRGRTEFYKGVYGVKLSKYADQPDVQPASALDVEATLAELEVLTFKHDRAEKRIAALQQTHASSPQVEETLAYMAWRDGRHEGAKQHFARAIELGSTNHRLYYDYGRFTCCTAQSVNLLRRSVELNPAFADASVELAIAAAYAKDYDLSLQTFSTLKKVSPDRAFDFFYAHALAHSQKGSRTEAGKLLDRAGTYAQDESRQRMIESLRQWLVWAAKRDQMLAQQGAQPAPPELESESAPRRLQRRAAPRSPENDPVVPGDPSISTIGAGDRALHPGESRKRIQGRLQALECAGGDPVLVVATGEGTLRLTFDDFQKVSIRGTGSSTHEFVCGPLKNVPVSVEFLEAEPRGFVRIIDFQAAP